jgi:hypothetical protein
MFGSMSRWNIASIMFILTRYAPIAWLVSDIYGERHLTTEEVVFLLGFSHSWAAISGNSK